MEVYGPRYSPNFANSTSAGANAADPLSLLAVAYGLQILERGHQGDAVRQLQHALNQAGATPPLALDGIFGPKTEAALKGLQQRSGIAADGRFGIESLLALQSASDIDATRRWTGTDSRRTAPRQGQGRPPGTMTADEMRRNDDWARTRRNGAEGTTGTNRPVFRPENSATNGRDVSLNIPWFSQFDRGNVPGAGNDACYRAVREMGNRSGLNLGASTENRIQVASGEDGAGRVRTDRSRTTEARSYIDQQLNSGRPVAVGVSHKQANYNRDGITDHFVMITGRGVDEQGRSFYTYNDPATRDRGAGANNRFYVDANSGNLVHQGNLASGYVRDRHTELSMVIRSA